MPVVQKNQEELKYVFPTDETIHDKAEYFRILYNDFLARINKQYGNSLRIDSFGLDLTALEEIIIRADKRREHARIFHDINDSAEYRMTALYCYWIIKLHPFELECSPLPGKEDLFKKVPFKDSAVNESFAVYLYIYIIKMVLKPTGGLSPEFIKELWYTFRYRDLNKATMVMLFEPRFELPQRTFSSGD